MQLKIKMRNALKRAIFGTFTYLMFFSAMSVNAYEYNLAVCTIFKNCAPYLREWIEFHRMMGVEHFYLYDNESDDHPADILEGYINQGIVTLIDWPNRNQESWGDRIFAWVGTTQKPAYEDCINLVKGRVRWLAVIDSDEFLTPMQDVTLVSFLKKHRDASALVLYWLVYGTANVMTIPPGSLMIELLTFRTQYADDINNHTKLILKPEAFVNFKGVPHSCTLVPGALKQKIDRNEVRITHYINRTVEHFYANKVHHKETMDNVTWNREYIDHWAKRGNDVEDLTMLRFVPGLRARMRFVQ